MDPKPKKPDPLLEDLLFECLEADDSRSALETACRDHPTMAERLRNAFARLDKHELVAEGGFEAIPERLGRFRLIRRLGEGGMGIVYLADDEDLGRRVAIKLIRPEHVYFPKSRARFQREVEAVARLSHPGIVNVHSVGDENGLPYFSMEYIEGRSLSEILDGLRGRSITSLRGRDLTDARDSDIEADAPWPLAVVRLVLGVAHALRHAHERGVVHRDVKPSNIMLDHLGRSRLTDFGLAGLEDAQQLTRTRSELGSLPYMPPEVVDGKATQAEPNFDIYSLGVTLYELLTLTSPFVGPSLERTRANIVTRNFRRPRVKSPQVSRDLETVCLTMMAGTPAQRYASTSDVVDELERVLDNRPILARRSGPLRRALQWSQRRPAAAVALLLAFSLFCIVPIGIAVWQSDVAREAVRLQQVARGNAYVTAIAAAAGGVEHNNYADAQRNLELCPEELRRWEWHYLNTLLHNSEQTFLGHTDGLTDVALVDDTIFSCARDGTLRAWSEDGSGQIVAADDEWIHVLMRHDEHLLYGGRSGVLHRLDPISHASEVALDLGHPIRSLAKNANDTLLAIGGDDGSVHLVDLPGFDNPRMIEQPDRVPTFAVQFAGPTRLLATEGKAFLCWNDALADDAPRRLGNWRGHPDAASITHPVWVSCLDVIDGVVTTFDGNGWIGQWDLESGRAIKVLEHYRTGGIDRFARLSDGTILAAGASVLLRLTPGRWPMRYRGHVDDVSAIDVDEERGWIVTGSRDRSVRRWRLAPPQPVLIHEASVRDLDVTNESILTVSDKTLRVWPRDGDPKPLEIGLHDRALEIAAHPDSTHALLNVQGSGYLIELRAGAEPELLTSGTDLVEFAWFEDGSGAYLLQHPAKLLRWDFGADSPTEIADLGFDSKCSAMALQPGGTHLLLTDVDGVVRIVDAESPSEVRIIADHGRRARDCTFTPDGKVAISCAYDSRIKFRDVETGLPAREDLIWSAHNIESLAMHPDGKRLAAGAINDSLIAIFDMDRDETILVLSDHRRAALALAFTPDGHDLVSGSWDRTARIWPSGYTLWSRR